MTQHNPHFVNLSNHPSQTWKKAQRDAASDFAPHIVDIPFPQVPPEADTNAIEQLADVCLTALPPHVTHAMISGEYTLTLALVTRMQARGITCMAATTKRKIIQEKDGQKTTLFQFVQFRQYPNLSSPEQHT